MAEAAVDDVYLITDEDDDEEEELLLLLVLHRRRQGYGRKWVHELNLDRQEHGEFHVLYHQLRNHPDRFHTYFRMSVEQFDQLKALWNSHLLSRIQTTENRCLLQKDCV